MTRRHWGFVAFFAVATALTLGLSFGFEAIDSPASAACVLLVAVATLLMGAGLYLRPGPRLPWLCDPLLLAFAFLSQFYVLGALGFQIFGTQDLPFMRPFSSWRPVQASTAFVLLVAAILAGYVSRFGSVLEAHLPGAPRGGRRPSGVWVEALVIGGSLVGCIAWLQYQGGLMAKLSEGYSAGRAGGAMFVLAHQGMVSGTLLMGWRIFSKSAITWRDKVALTLVLAFDGIFLGLIFGVRKYLFFLFFGLVAIWILRRGWASLPKVRVTAILAGLLIFFSVWGAVRANSMIDLMSGRRDARILKNPGDVRPYISSVSDPYAVACLVWELFPHIEPHRHGKTLLVTVLGFIPRAVWPNKPVGIGKEITRYLVGPYYEAYHGFSVTVTMPADLYLNFGWTGVLIGGLLLGVACRTVAEYAARGMRGGIQTDAARVLLPAVFLIGLAELRADMAVMLATYVLTYWPILGCLVFFRTEPKAALAPSWSAGSTAPATLT